MDIRYGASFPGAEYASYGDGVEALLGKKLGIQQVMHSLTDGSGHIELRQMLEAGRTPMIQAGPAGSGSILFQDILAGKWDAPILTLCQQAEAVKHLGVVLLRTMHEVNCCYGWRVLGGDVALGNLYKQAWNHFYNLIHANTDNLLVGWCPSIEFLGDNIDYRFDSTFVGWEKMDWVGWDSYWIHADQGWEVCRYTLDHLNQLGMQESGKKLIVCEWGVQEMGGAAKGNLVRRILGEWFPQIPNLLAVLQFHFFFQGDRFQMDSSPESLQAYKEAYAPYSSAMLTKADFVGGGPPPVPEPNVVYASDQAFTIAKNGWGTPRKDLSIEGKPLRLAGVTYVKGLGLHADAEVLVPVPANATRFTAKAGIDDEVQAGTGSVECSVVAGTNTVKSPVMKQGISPHSFDVDVTGKTEMRLLATSPTAHRDFDHVDFVDAKFLLAVAPPAPDYEQRIVALEAWKAAHTHDFAAADHSHRPHIHETGEGVEVGD